MQRWTADVPPLEVKASIPFFNDRISRFGSHFAVISVGPVFYHPRPVLFLTKACPLMEDIVLRNRHAVVVYKPWSKATGRTRSSEVYPKCDQNATHVFSVKNPSFRRVLVGDTRTSPEYLPTPVPFRMQLSEYSFRCQSCTFIIVARRTSVKNA
jgi:hypothetical protein